MGRRMWSEGDVRKIKELHSKGSSLKDIAREFRVTVGAMQSKMSRLGLLKRGTHGVPRVGKGPTLQPLSSCVRPDPTVFVPRRWAVPRERAASVVPLAVRSPSRPPAGSVRPPERSGRTTACQWPFGEPGTPGFHFCDTNAVPGKSYCEEHVALAYVKVRDRREDAA